MDIERTRYMRELRRGLIEYFNLDELETLTFDLSLAWDDLRGETKSVKAQSLIVHLARRGSLENLVVILKEERPKVDWIQPPPPEQQIEDERYVIPDSERAAALQEYIDKIKHLVGDKGGEEQEYPGYTVALLRAYTNAVVSRLDINRLSIVIRFLGDIEALGFLNFNNLQLNGVDLEAAHLGKALLKQSDFSGANLKKAIIAYANLQAANLRKANLREANLSYSNLIRAELAGADLRSATLQETKMNGANFTGASLASADFTKADLRGADFSDASLRNADLREANLRGAQLTKAKNLSSTNLQGAMYNDETQWPPRFSPEEAGALLSD